MIELLLPKHCAGCGAPGATVCTACQRALAQPPQRIFTQVNPHIPVWALGTYAGVHRAMVLGMKERGRRDVPAVLGPVLHAAAQYLVARGELPELDEIQVVPAPTKRASARMRGGDPVTLVARAARFDVVSCVEHSRAVRESVGLDAVARRKNLAGGVVRTGVPTKPALIVDDVVTTGATISATAAVLMAANVQVVGALAICFA